LYDTDGSRRTDFALADLFGVTAAERADTNYDCYQLIRAPAHPILTGIQDTELLINGGETLLCTITSPDTHTAVCTHVPKITNQPPERAWVDSFETPHPTIVVGGYGSGQVVYFANQTDRLCETKGHEDLRNTLAGALRWLLGGSSSLDATAPSSVHVHMLRAAASDGTYVVSLVNLTSGPQRPLREILPVSDIGLTVHVPAQRFAGLEPLRAPERPRVVRQRTIPDGRVEVTLRLGRLEEFTSIRLDFEV
jgi:hypothetical protein